MGMRARAARRASGAMLAGAIGLVGAALPSHASAACPDVVPSYTSACGPLITWPQWSDGGGWSAPSAYETIQLADLDGRPGDELLGRDSYGVWVQRWDAAAGQWIALGGEDGLALVLSDLEGWNAPSRYRTMRAADVDGDGAEELLVRGPSGIRVYGLDPASDRLVREDDPTAPALLSDEDGFEEPSRYLTVTTADVDGDGRAELLARDGSGLRAWDWSTDGSRRWIPLGAPLGALSDANRGDLPQHYESIRVGDLAGAGRDAVLADTSAGVHAYLLEGGRWVQYGDTLPGSDPRCQGGGSGPIEAQVVPKPTPPSACALIWREARTYQSLRVGDVDGDGRDELLVRDPATGLQAWGVAPDAGTWRTVGPALGDLANVDYNMPQHYFTIRPADVVGDGRDEVVARGSYGVDVWRLGTGGWASLTAAGEGGARRLLGLTASVWSSPQHYRTFQLGDLDGSGRASLVARGVFGIRTFRWDVGEGVFARPRDYGYPPFTGAEEAAYKALGRQLNPLNPNADLRRTFYATGVAAVESGELFEKARQVELLATPPDGVDPGAWDRVRVEIAEELRSAARAQEYFARISRAQDKAFLTSEGTLPALQAALSIEPQIPTKDYTPSILKMVKSGLEIVGDVLKFFPGGNAPTVAAKLGTFLKENYGIAASISLTAHIFGAVGEGIGGFAPPSKPSDRADTWAEVNKQVVASKGYADQVIRAQREYTLADKGLTGATGGMYAAGLLSFDEGAFVDGQRRAYVTWAAQQVLPGHWSRYSVEQCYKGTWTYLVTDVRGDCAVPSGPNVRLLRTYPLHPNGGSGAGSTAHDFLAVLDNRSTCTLSGLLSSTTGCTWVAPQKNVADIVFGEVTDECTYIPGAPGRTGTFRYGCSLGARDEVLDERDGWSLPNTACLWRDVKRLGGRTGWECSSLAAARVTGADVAGRLGDARLDDLAVSAEVAVPQVVDLRRARLSIVDLLAESDDGVLTDEVAFGANGATLAGGTARAGGIRAGTATYVRRGARGSRVVVRLRRSGGTLRATLRAENVRVQTPPACDAGARRVRLETQLSVSQSPPHGDAVLVPLAASWTCVRAGGRVVDLRAVAGR